MLNLNIPKLIVLEVVPGNVSKYDIAMHSNKKIYTITLKQRKMENKYILYKKIHFDFLIFYHIKSSIK